MYWKIEPYETRDADYCVMAAETEDDHRAALDYAYKRLEDQWDQLRPGEEAMVTIRLCEGEVPEVEEAV